MELSKKTLKKIDNSNTVKGMLADTFKKSHQTIQRWVAENNVMLTHIESLKIYKEVLGIEQEEAVQV